MGLYSFLTGGQKLASAQTPTMIASPFGGPSDYIQEAIVNDWFGELAEDATEVVTPELALRIPEVKAALRAHTSLVAPLKFEVYHNGEKDAEQPFWVANTDYPVSSPYLRQKGLVTDLFLYGWALLGATVDPATDLPRDMVHVAFSLWDIDHNTGSITLHDSVPMAYRQRLILISLGTNGLFVDGIDSIRQARKLERARQLRLDSPPPGTNIHISDQQKKAMSNAEKREIAKGFSANRRESNVVVTVDGQELKDIGGQKLDLFESAMNSLRIQIANHAGVPASFLEAGKEGGSNGQLSYSNTADKNSELWLFGASEYAYAIAARLSQADVVGPDAEVRVDLTPITFPAPTELDPEAPGVPAPQPAAEPEAPTE